MTRSLHVTIDVERVVAGDGPEVSPVRFGLVVDDVADARALRDGLVGQTVVAFLTASPVFDYEAELYGVVIDGGLLCRFVVHGRDRSASVDSLASCDDRACGTTGRLAAGQNIR